MTEGVSASSEGLPAGLVVGSMCHCGERDNCDDHWEFFIRAEMSYDGEHVGRGGHLNEAEMRAVVALVRAHNGEEPQPLPADEGDEDAVGRAVTRQDVVEAVVRVGGIEKGGDVVAVGLDWVVAEGLNRLGFKLISGPDVSGTEGLKA